MLPIGQPAPRYTSSREQAYCWLAGWNGSRSEVSGLPSPSSLWVYRVCGSMRSMKKGRWSEQGEMRWPKPGGRFAVRGSQLTGTEADRGTLAARIGREAAVKIEPSEVLE